MPVLDDRTRWKIRLQDLIPADHFFAMLLKMACTRRMK